MGLAELREKKRKVKNRVSHRAFVSRISQVGSPREKNGGGGGGKSCGV